MNIHSYPFVFILLMSAGLVLGPVEHARSQTGEQASDRAGATPEVIVPQYEPNRAFPVGRLNPEAPPETTQFDFLLGPHDCNERMRQPGGDEWKQVAKTWNGIYFMNGHAIRDDTWRADGVSTTNIRVYDAGQGEWVVTWFSVPGASSGVWKGGKEGEKMVLRQDGQSPQGPYVSRLSFFNINDAGFEWVSEVVLPNGTVFSNWKSTCKRRP